MQEGKVSSSGGGKQGKFGPESTSDASASLLQACLLSKSVRSPHKGTIDGKHYYLLPIPAYLMVNVHKILECHSSVSVDGQKETRLLSTIAFTSNTNLSVSPTTTTPTAASESNEHNSSDSFEPSTQTTCSSPSSAKFSKQRKKLFNANTSLQLPSNGIFIGNTNSPKHYVSQSFGDTADDMSEGISTSSETDGDGT